MPPPGIPSLGVDTGGTFTDFVFGDRAWKIRSTPKDPARAVLEGLAALPEANRRSLRIVHGTTVATNALLTRRLARTAFVTTSGFEDLLEIGRQDRPDPYALEPRARPALVGRRDRYGVAERLRADGSVETPLDDDDVDAVVQWVRDAGAEAVAVCLLHAYRNGAHEERLGAALRGSGLPVSLSHRVANEFREVERGWTTAANAALLPVLAPYIERLQSGLEAHRFEVLQSSGGAAAPAEVAELPVRTVLSGPAGGVVAAAELARMHGCEAAVSFDMGGTSTDVALLRGEPRVVPEVEIGGLRLRVPVLDVYTVGAGGGSLAWMDALGALRVGPQSAGADPGPACYGIGTEPTVTDAHLALGNLSEADALAGTLRLDASRAHAALERIEGTAADVLRVADAAMERALRRVTVRRGVDPRPCALVAFGGAGGLHACALAAALNMRGVLVPPDPGTFSARGMAAAPRRRDFVRTVLLPARACVDRLDELLEPLRAEPAAVEELWAEVRYRGQSHELSVTANATLEEQFHAAHEQAYGYADRDREVEVVNLRRVALEPVPRPEPFGPPPELRAASGPPRMPRRELEGAVRGPCVLTEDTGTTVVPAGFVATRLRDGALWLEASS